MHIIYLLFILHLYTCFCSYFFRSRYRGLFDRILMSNFQVHHIRPTINELFKQTIGQQTYISIETLK
jgi:hypothetical protein